MFRWRRFADRTREVRLEQTIAAPVRKWSLLAMLVVFAVSIFGAFAILKGQPKTPSPGMIIGVIVVEGALCAVGVAMYVKRCRNCAAILMVVGALGFLADIFQLRASPSEAIPAMILDAAAAYLCYRVFRLLRKANTPSALPGS